MPLDLKSAIPVRQREDGLYEKDTFDLPSAFPYEEETISAPEEPFRYKPSLTEEQKAQAVVELSYKEEGEEVPVMTKADWTLTSPTTQMLTKNALGIISGAWVIPAYNALKGIVSATSPNADLGKMVFDSAYKGLAETGKVENFGGAAQNAYPKMNWALAGTMGALAELLLFAPGLVKAGATVLSKEQQYAKLLGDFEKSPRFNAWVNYFAEKSNAPKEVVYEKLRQGLWSIKDDISYFKIFMTNLRNATGVDLLGKLGAVRIPKVGETVVFKNPKGIALTGIIKEIVGERATIDIEGRQVVAVLSQLSLPKPISKGKQGIVEGEGKISVFYRTDVPIEQIKKEGFETLENTNEIFVSNTKEGQATGYGKNVIEIKVKKSDLRLDDEFSSGEKHFAIKKEIADKALQELPQPKAKLPKPFEGQPIGEVIKEIQKFTGEELTKGEKIIGEQATKQFLKYEKDIDELEEQIKLEKYATEVERIKAGERLEKLKSELKQKKEESKIRQDFKKEVANLITDIQKAGGKGIAVEYQEAIDKIRDKFDLVKRQEKTKARHEGMKEYVGKMMAQGKAINIPEEELRLIDKVNIENMTLDQLQQIRDRVKTLEQLGKTKLKARKANYESEKEKIKQKILSQATPIESKKLPKQSIEKKNNIWIEKAIKLQNYVQKTGVALTPMDGIADITGMGETKKALDVSFGNYLSYNGEIIQQWYELTKDFNDENFRRIGVVALTNQEGGLQRLENIGISEEDTEAIKLSLEEEKAYNFVVETFDNEYPLVKQYMKEIYNEDVGKVENYVSFISDYEAMSDLEIYERFGQTPEQITGRKTKTIEKGFTEERAKISTIKPEINIDKIFRRHMDDVAYMLTMGRNIKMYFEIVNSPEMREKLGDVGTLAWLQWLDLMARKGGVEGAKRIAALDVIRKNIGAGILSFRLSSALVQFSSFADTIATIGSEWATKGAVSISTSAEWRNFIMDNFPEIRKAIGDDIAFREFGEGMLANMTRTGTKPLQVLDGIMRTVAASGSYQKLSFEKGIVVDLANPDKDLIAEATRLMRNSQGSSFFKDQPLAITSGYGLSDNRSVNKLILTFQSFMLNRWDNINRQIWRLGIKEKDFAKAGTSLFWLIVFSGAVEEGIRRSSRWMLRKLTQKEQEEKPFLQNTALQMVQNVPLLGQLVSSITYSSNPVPAINVMEDMLSGLTSLIKGKATETKIKGVIRASGAGAALVGIPGSTQAAQILRDMIPKKKKKIVL